MIAKGAPITEVQHRLGHASPAITLQIYSHFIPQTESAAADRLADCLLRNPASQAESGKKWKPRIPQAESLRQSARACEIGPEGRPLPE
jgi:hypothetical protein